MSYDTEQDKIKESWDEAMATLIPIMRTVANYAMLMMVSDEWNGDFRLQLKEQVKTINEFMSQA